MSTCESCGAETEEYELTLRWVTEKTITVEAASFEAAETRLRSWEGWREHAYEWDLPDSEPDDLEVVWTR